MCWTCLRPHVCCFLDMLDGEKSPIPIGSMVLLYMVLHGSHQYTSTMDPSWDSAGELGDLRTATALGDTASRNEAPQFACESMWAADSLIGRWAVVEVILRPWEAKDSKGWGP